MDELLERIEEVAGKLEAGLLKHLSKHYKFADHYLPVFVFGVQDSDKDKPAELPQPVNP